MKLFDAYRQALNEDYDIKERAELSLDVILKNDMVEEISEAMKEIRDDKTPNRTVVDILTPLFKCVAFWFLIGIRVGKILRDAELAGE